MTEKLVRPPILGQLHGGPSNIAVILLELGLETAKKREGIGGGTGKASENLVLIESADLLRRMLDDAFAKSHLAISGENNAVVAAHAKNCSRTDQALVRHEGKLRL